MKVGLISHFLSRNSGGVFEVATRLSTELCKQEDIDSVLIGLEDERSESDMRTLGIENAVICPVVGPHAIGFSNQLKNALEQASLDVLHVHGLWMYPSVASSGWMARNGGGVVSPHGMLDPWALRQSRVKKVIAGLLYERSHLRRAAVLHALCEPELDAIRSFGLNKPVAIIPNGVDIPPHIETEIGSLTENIPAEAKTLLFLGRLHPKKNVLQLLRAWANIERMHSISEEWWLVIAGWDQGGHRQQIERLKIELGLRRCLIEGPKFGLEKDSLFRNCQAFVLPSLSEGLPMAILEAWSYGKPVLMTPACNLAVGFQTGAAIAVGTDVDALEEGIRQLLIMGDQERTDMGEAGLALVKNRYSWRQVAEQFASLYKWVAGGGPPPSEVLISGSR